MRAVPRRAVLCQNLSCDDTKFHERSDRSESERERHTHTEEIADGRLSENLAQPAGLFAARSGPGEWGMIPER